MKNIFLILLIFNISCHSSNITEDRMENKKKKIDSFCNLINSNDTYNKKVLDIKVKYKNKKIPSSIRKAINEWEVTQKKFDEYQETLFISQALERSYSNSDKIKNSINLMFYNILGDEKMIKMYQFEKDWFLPNGGKKTITGLCYSRGIGEKTYSLDYKIKIEF